jgi:hypothetical protein
VLVLVASIIAVSPTFGQDCASIFKYGLYDVTASSGSQQQSMSAANWLCSHSEDSSAMSASLSINVLDVFGLGGSGGNSSNAVRESCSDSHKRESLRRSFALNSQTINSKIVHAYQQCIAQGGAHAYLETTADPQVVRFVLQFASQADNDKDVTVKEDMVVKGAICAPSIKKSQKFGVSGTSSLCTRTPANAAVVVTFPMDHPNKSGTGDLSIPANVPITQTTEDLQDVLMNGNMVTFVTNDLKAVGGCVGSILPNSAYRLAFTRYNTGWIGEGPHGDGHCPPVNRDFLHNDSYKCDSYPFLCTRTPDKGYFILWGALFRFDGSSGEVRDADGSAVVGRISK